jgi:hypothetical protein
VLKRTVSRKGLKRWKKSRPKTLMLEAKSSKSTPRAYWTIKSRTNTGTPKTSKTKRKGSVKRRQSDSNVRLRTKQGKKKLIS